MASLMTYLKTTAIGLTSAIILTACGGGGGSSSSNGTPSGGGGTTGGGTSETITGLPALVEQSFPEGETQQFGNVQIFNINVSDPDIDVTNIRLTGPDSAFFEVFVVLTQDANDANMFELAIDPSVISNLDFEEPSDQGADNVYNLNLSFDYDSISFDIPIEISITNVAEAINVTVGFIQEIPTALRAVPDYSGDGLSELLLGTQVLASEDITASTNTLVSFFDDFLTTTFDPETFTSDVLGIDIIANPAGGINAIIQPSFGAVAMNVLALTTDADFNLLQGSIDGTTDHPSRISYTLPDNGGAFRQANAKLTSDINANGFNDIIYSLDEDDPMTGIRSRSYGIIFGQDVSSVTDNSRSFTPDVTINLDPNNFASLTGGITVHRVPDMDGDGIEELIIDDRFAGAIDPGTNIQLAEGLYTFIYSRTINDATGPISAFNLSANEGFQLYTPLGIDGASQATPPVTIGSDYDGDGNASIIIPFFAGMFVADMDGLSGLSSLNNVTTLPGYLSFVQDSLFSAASVGDLDGDTHHEIMYDQGIIAGQDIATALTSGSNVLEINSVVPFSVSNIGGSVRVENIIDLADHGLIALSGFDGTLLLERSEIEDAFSQSDSQIIFNVGQ